MIIPKKVKEGEALGNPPNSKEKLGQTPLKK